MSRYTKREEMERTAEMMVELAAERGVYFALALVYDGNRLSREDLKLQLDILQRTPGAIRRP